MIIKSLLTRSFFSTTFKSPLTSYTFSSFAKDYGNFHLHFNPQKENLFLNPHPSLVLHGIGLDLWKIPSIFQWGILSLEKALEKGLTPPLQYGKQDSRGKISNLYNGPSMISCALPPSHLTYHDVKYYAPGSPMNAYEEYIKESIAFAIQGLPHYPCNAVIGEVRIRGCVPPQHFRGLLISEDFLHQKISTLSFLDGQDSALHLRSQFLLQFLQKEEKISAPHLLEKVQSPCCHEIKTELKELFVEAMSKKLQKKDPFVADVLKHYIPKQLQWYNDQGFLIKI